MESLPLLEDDVADDPPNTPTLLRPDIAAAVIGVWCVFTAVLGAASGISTAAFFTWGPSATALFFGAAIDTWGKWFVVAAYVIVDRVVMAYGLDVITPWMMNNVQNKQRRADVGMPSRRVYVVLGVWDMYLWVSRIVGIQIVLLQIDFMVIVLAVDMGVTWATTYAYLS